MPLNELWRYRAYARARPSGQVIVDLLNDHAAHHIAEIYFSATNETLITPLCRRIAGLGEVRSWWMTHPNLEEFGWNPQATEYCLICVTECIGYYGKRR